MDSWQLLTSLLGVFCASLGWWLITLHNKHESLRRDHKDDMRELIDDMKKDLHALIQSLKEEMRTSIGRMK